MITSATSSTQIYSVNQVSKTRATSAYTEVESTSPTSRMEQMQEKYKDVYSPMPASYSEEREDLQIEKIREVYPDVMTIQEAKQWAIQNLKPVKLGEIESVEDKTIRETRNKEYIESVGGIEAYNERISFVHEKYSQYPVYPWGQGFSPSNAKEIVNFHNAAVYEGLEMGKDIKTAVIEANNSSFLYIDHSESKKHATEIMISKHEDIIYYDPTDSSKGEMVLNKTHSNKEGLGYGDTVDLRSYGFNVEWNLPDKPVQNDNTMASIIQKRLEMYDFMLENPTIVEKEFKKLYENKPLNGATSEVAILEPLRNQYRPNAELALKVYEKYKIFDSIDIKA